MPKYFSALFSKNQEFNNPKIKIRDRSLQILPDAFINKTDKEMVDAPKFVAFSLWLGALL
ncbi:hypothetical protein CEN47_06035 [Fischerella thermalis CCMEE 5319]|nr:hypothetical protein CEN47_06035 [Fischerella thermalis CCMEE 5319]